MALSTCPDAPRLASHCSACRSYSPLAAEALPCPALPCPQLSSRLTTPNTYCNRCCLHVLGGLSIPQPCWSFRALSCTAFPWLQKYALALSTALPVDLAEMIDTQCSREYRCRGPPTRAAITRARALLTTLRARPLGASSTACTDIDSEVRRRGAGDPRALNLAGRCCCCGCDWLWQMALIVALVRLGA